MSKIFHHLQLQTDSALIYDAVKLLAMALQDLDQGLSLDGSLPSCENAIPWKHGDSWLNYMRSVIIFLPPINKLQTNQHLLLIRYHSEA